jgi:hypothetical protein
MGRLLQTPGGSPQVMSVCVSGARAYAPALNRSDAAVRRGRQTGNGSATQVRTDSRTPACNFF